MTRPMADGEGGAPEAGGIPEMGGTPETGGASETGGATEAVVRVEDLRRSFDDTLALDGVSLEVRPGELFGLIGPDGAGKTTLFRTLTGLLVPDGGTVRTLGRDVVKEYREIRRRVGYMPGRASVYPDLSVEENLRFFASVHGTSLDEGYDLVAPVYSQIEEFGDRRASDLSGGMRQKLALSCALVHRPELLLLDEPTTGVDAVSRREFWELLASLAESGLTVMVSTPYMDEAGRCDRVALLQEGRVLRIASPGSIGEAFGRALVAVRGGDRHRLLRRLRERPGAESVYPFGQDLHYTAAESAESAEAVARELRAWLRDEGFENAETRPIEPGIEDVFMALMGRPAAA